MATIGIPAALDADPLFARGLNVAGGQIVHDVVEAAVEDAVALV